MRIFVFALLAVLPLVVLSGASSCDQDGHLRLYHTHTGEHLDIVYRHGNTYIPEALAKLDHFLRDSRTGDVHHYDPRVFDVVADAARAVGRANAEIYIICGYRTPKSNEYLRTHTFGVAKHSLHMQAEAIDIRLPGTSDLEVSERGPGSTARRRGILPGFGFHSRGRWPGSSLVVPASGAASASSFSSAASSP